MSVQTNFRAQDMLGAAKPEPKKAAFVPRVSAPAPRPEPIVVAPAVSVVEETVEAPAAEETSTEE
jgi:hypothetical protein